MTTGRPCHLCGQTLTANRLLRYRKVCGACASAEREGRLAARLERVRMRAGRPAEPRQRAEVSALGVGVKVVLLWNPEERGVIVRRERDAWRVWVDGYDMVTCWPKELKPVREGA